MMTENEVLNALTLLKNVCDKNQGRCCKCILRNAQNDCGVLYDSSDESYQKISEWELKSNDNPRVILN